MLVSAAFMQSMAAFTAQNKGAGRMDRAIKGLQCAMGLSCGCGLIMGFFTFFSRRHPGRPVYLFPIRYGSGGRLPKSLRF